MAKIGVHTINAAYESAKRVRAGQVSEHDAVADLASQHGMNEASATIYLRNLTTMLDGKTLKRAMSAPSFAIYLDRIADDYGRDAALVALKAVRSHIVYYNALGRGSLNGVSDICDAAEARSK